MAPIAVGDTIPDGKLSFVNEKDEFETVSIYSLITGKKALIMGVPGCFIPSYSWYYGPQQILTPSESVMTPDPAMEQLYISVNDPYVARAWGFSFFSRNDPRLKFLADSKAAYVTSLGFDLDLTSKGIGVRCKKFAMLLDDRKVVRLIESQIVLEYAVPSWWGPTPNISRAPIAVGDIIPDNWLTFCDKETLIKLVTVHPIVAGKKVIILGVRGAFSPSCRHFVQSFIQKAIEFKLMGVHEILCISVNDPYAMRAWERACFSDNTEINFLADPNAAYVASLGLVDDLSHTEFGIRSKRFALLLDDCKVVGVGDEGKLDKHGKPNESPLAEWMWNLILSTLGDFLVGSLAAVPVDNTEINLFAHPTAAYVASLGLLDDSSHTEFGICSKSFPMLLDDGKVVGVGDEGKLDEHGKPNESPLAEGMRNVVLPTRGDSVVASLASAPVEPHTGNGESGGGVEVEKKKKKKYNEDDGDEGRKRKSDDADGRPTPETDVMKFKVGSEEAENVEVGSEKKKKKKECGDDTVSLEDGRVKVVEVARPGANRG